jgi:type II secretory pathway component HofQ
LILLLSLYQTADTETKINIDVKEADVLDLLRLLAEVEELNLVAKLEVSCSATLKLKGIPCPQVLVLVLRTCGLAQNRLRDNLLRIATAERLTKEYEQRRRYEDEKRLTGPLQTTYRKLAYGSAHAWSGEVSFVPRVGRIRRTHQYLDHYGRRALQGRREDNGG